MIKLRDMQKSDIEDYVRWFTKDTEWMNWDAPWEDVKANELEERISWTKQYQYTENQDSKKERCKFEIEMDGKHIGWVCAYYDLEYLENKEKILAIGIDIPEKSYRCKGYGTKAIQLFIQYLKSKGHQMVYIQTWSGNYPILKVIEKLGFQEFYRKKRYRVINNKEYDAITYKLNILL